jgi:hypothetical protein
VPQDSLAVLEVVFVVVRHVTQRQIDAFQMLANVEVPAVHVLLETELQHA